MVCVSLRSRNGSRSFSRKLRLTLLCPGIRRRLRREGGSSPRCRAGWCRLRAPPGTSPCPRCRLCMPGRMEKEEPSETSASQFGSIAYTMRVKVGCLPRNSTCAARQRKCTASDGLPRAFRVVWGFWLLERSQKCLHIAGVPGIPHGLALPMEGCSGYMLLFYTRGVINVISVINQTYDLAQKKTPTTLNCLILIS